VVERGSPGELKQLLARGADPNEMGEDGVTPICSAAEEGHLEVVVALLDAGVPAGFGGGIEVPLNAAAGEGHVEVVKLLLERGADVHEMGEEGVTTLVIAAAGGQLELVKLLVGAGADPTFRPEFGDLGDAASCARANGHTEVADYLDSAASG
jgi:ankyrin repeat protein